MKIKGVQFPMVIGRGRRREHPNQHVVLLRKKYGKKSKAGQGLFRSRDFVTSGEKGLTRADFAQLPVAHAQNILPNRTASGHGLFRPRD